MVEYPDYTTTELDCCPSIIYFIYGLEVQDKQ